MTIQGERTANTILKFYHTKEAHYVPAPKKPLQAKAGAKCSMALLLSKKRICLQLHISSLSDYCRNAMIPRGLKIQKGPATLSEVPQFMDKCFSI